MGLFYRMIYRQDKLSESVVNQRFRQKYKYQVALLSSCNILL